MLYLLLNVIVYALAVIFALLLTPGIHVGEQRGIIEWFVVGGVYGLLNAFIRPVIVLFTGRLLIRSLGLFLIVINAILLFVLAWVFGWTVDSVFWLLWGGLVIGIGTALLDALFGLNRPLFKESKETSRLWSRGHQGIGQPQQPADRQPAPAGGVRHALPLCPGNWA